MLRVGVNTPIRFKLSFSRKLRSLDHLEHATARLEVVDQPPSLDVDLQDGIVDRAEERAGFGDAGDGFGDDEARSLERARTAALELERRGVKAEGVKGFGAALPVGPADDEAGRRRKRRVEVWLKEGF